MTRDHYGTFYMVTPSSPRDSDCVVETIEYGRSHLDVAKELWTMAGDVARVRAIDAIVYRAFEREDRAVVAADIDELLALLDGLDQRLGETILDERQQVRPERMAHVRRRAVLVNVSEARGPLAAFGVLEGMSRVSELRTMLRTARERGLDVALD